MTSPCVRLPRCHGPAVTPCAQDAVPWLQLLPTQRDALCGLKPAHPPAWPTAPGRGACSPCGGLSCKGHAGQGGQPPRWRLRALADFLSAPRDGDSGHCNPGFICFSFQLWQVLLHALRAVPSGACVCGAGCPPRQLTLGHLKTSFRVPCGGVCFCSCLTTSALGWNGDSSAAQQSQAGGDDTHARGSRSSPKCDLPVPVCLQPPRWTRATSRSWSRRRQPMSSGSTPTVSLCPSPADRGHHALLGGVR